MLNGLPVHANLNASSKAATSTLVPASLVNLAPATFPGFAGVLLPPPNRPFEESSAAVTSKDPIMLARGEITTHLARCIIKDPARGADTPSPFGCHRTAIIVVRALFMIVWTAAADWVPNL
jgi:hypothetical protein